MSREYVVAGEATPAYINDGDLRSFISIAGYTVTTSFDPPPPPVTPTGEGGLPVGGGNIWYVSEEMLRRYREHQARLRKYEPEDDREALRAIVERAVRGEPEAPVTELAKEVQAVAADEYDFRAPLREIRALLAEVERLGVLYTQRDEEEIFIVGMLS